MAVNIIKEKAGIHGTCLIEHHRNPSGVINKSRWLLEKSKRNPNVIHEIVASRLIISGYSEWKSWLHAESLAICTVVLGYKTPDETSKKVNKINRLPQNIWEKSEKE
jgi:hypothetical protein